MNPIDLSQFTFKIENLLQLALGFTINLIIAYIIFWVGRWLAKRIVTIVSHLMGRTRLDETLASFLSNLLYGILLIVVILSALSKIGINTNSFVAVLGGAAVAVGLALKDQLANFAAGVMIIVFRPFSRGDTVEINGKTGVIQDITLVNTRLVTANNHEIIIPNSDVTTNAIINFSMRQTRRVDITIGIGYGADIKAAKSIMLSMAKNHPKSLTSPEPVVRVTDLGDNAVELTLNVWANNADWYTLQCDLLEQIKYGFDTQKIDIPFPQRNLHIDGLDTLIKNQVYNKKDDVL